MALEFARTTILSRSAGHSAVKAAAYRAGERLIDDRIGRVVDYSHRSSEVGFSEILLPEGADPALLDRRALWGAVEDREDLHNRRASAQLAIDHVIALPRELSQSQHVELAKAFAHSELVSRGVVVDLAIHYHSEGNPHAHLMSTTRTLSGRTFGAKTRSLFGQFYGGQKIAEKEQLRHRWAQFQNSYFLAHDIDAHVTTNDGQFVAEVHLGPASGMSKKGQDTALQADNTALIEHRELTILDEPEIVIARVSDRKSIFTRHDLYRELISLVDDGAVFALVKAKLDTHPWLVSIPVSGKEFLTTHAVLEAEMAIRGYGDLLARDNSAFAINDRIIERSLNRQSSLPEEQKQAVHYVLSAHQLSTIVGLAGAGKSSLLKLVRQIYEASDHRVTGIALAGKAAEELALSAGIESRTIASWLLALREGRETLKPGDVVTLDEAGMVPNHLMLQVLERIQQAGAKLIQLGDSEQLQAIRTGCPFRDLSIQHGYAELSRVRRQSVSWQRQATSDLARGRVAEAVGVYETNGCIHRFDRAIDARAQLVDDYVHAGDDSRIVLAHRRADVDALNSELRRALVARGLVEEGGPVPVDALPDVTLSAFEYTPGEVVQFRDADTALGVASGETAVYVATIENRVQLRLGDGRLLKIEPDRLSGVQSVVMAESPSIDRLGAGERVLFMQNDRQLGVKNGSLGTVLSIHGDQLSVRVDRQVEPVTFRLSEYPHLALGYATTIHKAQGMSVDRSFIYGSATMDKHLGYVSMSRHRDRMDLYLSSEALNGQSFSRLLSRTHRQETALAFAERHGLEPDLSPPDPLRFEVFDTHRTGEAEAGMHDRDSAHLLAHESVDPEVADAQTLLTARVAECLATLESNHELLIEQRRHQLDIVELRLTDHNLAKPREGVLSNKRAIAAWREAERALKIERGNALRALKREETLFRGRDGFRVQEAERLAAVQEPGADRRVRQYKANRRIAMLTEQWRELERRLAGATNLGKDQNTLTALHRSLDVVLQKLERDPDVQALLTESHRAEIAQSRHQLQRAQEVVRALKRGRGLDRR